VSPSLELLLPIAMFFGSFFLVLFIFKKLSDTFCKWLEDMD